MKPSNPTPKAFLDIFDSLIRLVSPVAPYLVFALAALGILQKAWTQGFWWVTSAIFLVLLLQLSIAVKSPNWKKRDESQLKKEQNELLHLYNVLNEIEGGAAGRIATIVALVNEGQMEEAEKATYKSQSNLLQLASDIVRYLTGAGEGEIMSNLMIAEGEQLKIVSFSRDTHDRKPMTLPLGETIPGAPRAFLTQMHQYVDNTETTPGFEAVKDRPYKTILSIPVTIRADDGKELHLGVLNVDSRSVDAFKEKVEILIPALAPTVAMIASTITLLSICQTSKRQA